MSNKVLNNNPQCQIIWFNWTKEENWNISESFNNLKELSESIAYDISNHLFYFSFTKDKSSPSGYFTMHLDNSRDWKNVLKPGEWFIALMSQEGNLFVKDKNEDINKNFPSDLKAIFEFDSKKIDENKKRSLISGLKKGPQQIDGKKVRAVCYVDRVAVSVSTGANGELITYYEVSGRDYGCIYEDTEIWLNWLQLERITVDNLTAYLTSKNGAFLQINDFLKFLHDFFLGFRNNEKMESALKKTGFPEIMGNQWVMPNKLVNYLNQSFNKNPLYGEIKNLLNFDQTILTLALTFTLSSLSGRCWDKLKEYSLDAFHELFVELSEDGQMQLHFRPIPWAFNKEKYPTAAPYIKTYKQLANESDISIDSSLIINYNLGEDSHNRYNHFFVIPAIANINREDAISLLFNKERKDGTTFPYGIFSSIARNGLRLKHFEVNSFALAFVKKDKNKSGDVDKNLLKEYNEISLDYWKNAFLFESGSIQIIGQNNIKLGKVLKFDETLDYDPNKVFYIEGYTDEFIVNQNGSTEWTQTINVTRGIETINLNKTFGLSRRNFTNKNRDDYLGE